MTKEKKAAMVPTPATSVIEEEEKNEKFLHLHIGEINFAAGDNTEKLNIKLGSGIDIDYVATTENVEDTEETKETETKEMEKLTDMLTAAIAKIMPIQPARVTPSPMPIPSTSTTSAPQQPTPQPTNAPEPTETKTQMPVQETTISKEEYKRLIGSMSDMQSSIMELAKIVEKLSSNK